MPKMTYEIVGFDPAEWMAGLAESRRNPVPASEPEPDGYVNSKREF